MIKRRELITRQDLDALSHAYQVRFACFCARQVLHLVREKDREVCENAVITAEKWLIGEATSEECSLAANAANAAHAAYAAHATANTAAHAAYAAAAAAAHAAYAANAANAAAAAAATVVAHAANAAAALKDKQKLIDEQWDFYNDLLNVDKHLEDAIGLEVV